VRAAVPAQSVLAPVALANLGAADAPIRLRMVPTARGQALVLNARQTGYVYCYAQDPATQAIRRIFPNRFDKDPRVVAGSAVALPGRGRFVLSADHDHACLFAEREVYGDLPAVLRWGDFQDVRARSFDEIRDRFVESTGAQIALVRAAPLQVARAAR
jgi:ADP-dependent phosphofructokinase/glucokinase